jgi:hypothetical protein
MGYQACVGMRGVQGVRQGDEGSFRLGLHAWMGVRACML